MVVRVQSGPFDMGAETEAFTKAAEGAGAVVTFSGLVRDEGGTLSGMEIEHYPGMTEKALGSICDQAIERWSLVDALVIHRHGPLKPGEQIMMVATASKHRAHAFEAAEFLMDYLKSRAPFWKKEHHDTTERWVEAKSSDEAALDRWAD